MPRILLQTTIPFVEDDWHIGRFSRLTAHLASLPDAEVTARDRAVPGGQTDPVLGGLAASDFDQLWLFAVDVGDGLNAEECAAIGAFRARGGGVMITRDHMDLGSSVCSVGGVGEAHYFHSSSLDPDPDRNCRDDVETGYIDFPNYHSGSNGDWQPVQVVGEVHPLLRDEDGRALDRLPAHPHEGGVGAPAGVGEARVIATGASTVTGRPFNLAVAFEGGAGQGRGLAQSTFHHFADYNWDPRDGCPSFVSEAPGDGMLRDPEALRQTQRYMTNLARWLSGG
ncbi:hypothetical protein [Brevundimonas sp. Root1279]|uniref:hypothetical protein n=1 Tax=Brevundimonas sp. Root1279 TaxID=1736443 RepID=UPI0006F74CE1|nr:hypothetical protein [Brevundimonas sp. Root1279]KQW84010.1 hypothetical protein ASC65_05145 [Brevundimonas sp. Root1279]